MCWYLVFILSFKLKHDTRRLAVYVTRVLILWWSSTVSFFKIHKEFFYNDEASLLYIYNQTKTFERKNFWRRQISNRKTFRQKNLEVFPSERLVLNILCCYIITVKTIVQETSKNIFLSYRDIWWYDKSCSLVLQWSSLLRRALVGYPQKICVNSK